MKKLLTLAIILLSCGICYADIAWYICPYKRDLTETRPTRYCAMDDYTQQIIYIDGGNWTEIEILGDRAIVKVRASAGTLAILDSVFKRLPKDRLDDSLSSLSSGVKNAIKNEILDAGYSSAELQGKFGNDIGNFTLRDVLKFMARRRLKPRYDNATDTVICDGAVQPVRAIEDVDATVK